MLEKFKKLESVQIMALAIKQSDLDCSMWDKDTCEELAVQILLALQKASYQLYEYK